MDVLAITGPSGSGKTTRVLELIALYRAEGKRVGCIKHTHHPLNEDDRGDTGKMRAAGAEPVILAGDGEAVVFERGGTRRIVFHEPRALLAEFDVDVVLVEGWKDYQTWA